MEFASKRTSNAIGPKEKHIDNIAEEEAFLFIESVIFPIIVCLKEVVRLDEIVDLIFRHGDFEAWLYRAIVKRYHTANPVEDPSKFATRLLDSLSKFNVYTNEFVNRIVAFRQKFWWNEPLTYGDWNLFYLGNSHVICCRPACRYAGTFSSVKTDVMFLRGSSTS